MPRVVHRKLAHTQPTQAGGWSTDEVVPIDHWRLGTDTVLLFTSLSRALFFAVIDVWRCHMF